MASKNRLLLKKLLAVGIILLVFVGIICSVGCSITAQANESIKEYGDFTYEIGENGIIISKYNGTEENVVIFDELDGIKVTCIGNYAFNGNSNVTSVIIPESVLEIGYEAFSECINLKSVIIPAGVTSIWPDAFRGCISLETISVDENNITYDSRDNCNAIIVTANNAIVIGCKNTVIPQSVTRIGSSAFKDCSSLTSIDIPSGVREIGDSAFKGCTNLTNVNISEGVTSISWTAFMGCVSLTNVEIPASVTSIGHGAFYNCSSLSSIKVHNNNKVYDSRNNCNAIVDTAHNSLVAGCKNTIIPDDVTYIDRGAFKGCIGLTSLYIPDSVAYILNGAFEGCNNLTIYGKTGSCAETYARLNNITFILISSSNVTTENNGRNVDNSEKDNSINSEAGSGTENKSTTGTGKSETTAKSTTGTGKSKNITKSTVNSGTSVNINQSSTTKSTTNKAIAKKTKTKTPAKKGTTLTVASKKIKVKVTSSKASNPTVAFLKSTNKKAQTITIPATVKVNGVTYKVTSIANNAFKGNKKLTKVTIGKNVTSIGSKAFYKCTKLKSVTIPAKVKTIGAGAFSGCKKLKKINITAGKLKTIGKNAFKGISRKASITLKGTKKAKSALKKKLRKSNIGYVKTWTIKG